MPEFEFGRRGWALASRLNRGAQVHETIGKSGSGAWPFARLVAPQHGL
jgi:hypothetical protein